MSELGIAALVAGGLGLLFMFTGHFLLALVMLGTAFVLDRLSPETKNRVSSKQFQEIEDYANKRDEHDSDH